MNLGGRLLKHPFILMFSFQNTYQVHTSGGKLFYFSTFLHIYFKIGYMLQLVELH